MTPAQVKARFRREGKTITSWASEHKFRREAVYRVLNGADKALYGQAHQIAVALGLKEPATAQQHAA